MICAFVLANLLDAIRSDSHFIGCPDSGQLGADREQPHLPKVGKCEDHLGPLW